MMFLLNLLFYFRNAWAEPDKHKSRGPQSHKQLIGQQTHKQLTDQQTQKQLTGQAAAFSEPAEEDRLIESKYVHRGFS